MTLIELMVAVAIVAVLVALLLPILAPPRHRSGRINCTNLLKQVGLGYRMWSLDHGDKFQMQVSATNGGVMELIAEGYVASAFLVMSNELNSPGVLWCPADSQRLAASTFSGLANSNVNYFVGLDADETKSQTFISGDDDWLIDETPVVKGSTTFGVEANISWSTNRHDKQGNIGFADGSVQGFSTPKLREALRNTGTNVIRLAFP